jgi:two-component system response regulator FixJ
MAKVHDKNFTVYVVEDDEAHRLSLKAMLESVGQPVKIFPDAKSFLTSYEADPDAFPGCIVLDVRMPGMSGLDLQNKLNQLQSILPIIFVTGHGDIPMAVEAVGNGALGFLTKPFREQELLDKIYQALQRFEKNHQKYAANNEFATALATLTPREMEILERVVAGQASKVIAIELTISERTVEAHRSNLFKKLNSHSLTEVTRKFMAIKGRE